MITAILIHITYTKKIKKINIQLQVEIYTQLFVVVFYLTV